MRANGIFFFKWQNIAPFVLNIMVFCMAYVEGKKEPKIPMCNDRDRQRQRTKFKSRIVWLVILLTKLFEVN